MAFLQTHYRDTRTGKFVKRTTYNRSVAHGGTRYVAEEVLHEPTPGQVPGIVIRIGYDGRENSYTAEFEVAMDEYETEEDAFADLSTRMQAGEFDDEAAAFKMPDLRWTSTNNYKVVRKASVASGTAKLTGWDRSPP